MSSTTTVVSDSNDTPKESLLVKYGIKIENDSDQLSLNNSRCIPLLFLVHIIVSLFFALYFSFTDYHKELNIVLLCVSLVVCLIACMLLFYPKEPVDIEGYIKLSLATKILCGVHLAATFLALMLAAMNKMEKGLTVSFWFISLSVSIAIVLYDSNPPEFIQKILSGPSLRGSN